MAANSCRSIKSHVPGAVISGWKVWANLTASDHYPNVGDTSDLNNPFDAQPFLPIPGNPDLNALGDTPMYREIGVGGRVFVANTPTERFEVLPLFTKEGGAAYVQVWGFDFIEPESLAIKEDIPELLRPSTDACYGLGVAYSLTRDIALAPGHLSITASDDFGKYTISSKGVMYPDPQAGEVYYAAPREIFNVSGLWAYFAWVPYISDGGLVLLARAI